VRASVSLDARDSERYLCMHLLHANAQLIFFRGLLHKVELSLREGCHWTQFNDVCMMQNVHMRVLSPTYTLNLVLRTSLKGTG